MRRREQKEAKEAKAKEQGFGFEVWRASEYRILSTEYRVLSTFEVCYDDGNVLGCCELGELPGG